MQRYREIPQVDKDVARETAQKLCDTAQNAGILINAISDYIGVSDVTFLYWRRGDTTPRRGDIYLMTFITGLIEYMSGAGALVGAMEKAAERTRINTEKFLTELEQQNVF